MTEKYKIYLSEDIKTRLINDAELFEFTKSDGKVNLNGFLKELTVNYFGQYRGDNEELTNKIAADLTSANGMSHKEASLLADRIIKTYINNSGASSGKSIVITYTVSGPSYDVIKIIENNFLRDCSLSGYIKDMFLSYLSMPRNKREEIIFARNYELIREAVAKRRLLTFTASDCDDKITVKPYLIMSSKEEQFGYLLCQDSRTGKNRSFRVSRLKNIFVTNDIFEAQKETEEELTKLGLRSPHSMRPNVHAKIKMTEHGKKMYKMIIKNRPAVSEIDGDYYYFDWPELLLEEYFSRFGKDAVAVSPRSLRTKLRAYYASALEAYGEDKKRE